MKKFIEWSEELSVGIQEIDEQHKVLVNCVNELHDALDQKRGFEVTAGILSKLDEYTRVHFAVEESLMRIMGYPEYERHKKEHDNLIEQLTTIREKYTADHHSVTFELMYFLKQWLTHHILETDKHYSPYLLARGIKPQLSKRSWVEKLWHSIGSTKG
jgi:hemerythrin